MRVISGIAGGRRLKELQGMETRPTTDKVKESLFNIIQFDIPGRRVLDLFSGTGQLGIEALSRGAKSAVFVDAGEPACRLIRENLKRTKLEDQGKGGLKERHLVVVTYVEIFVSQVNATRDQGLFNRNNQADVMTEPAAD